MTIQDQIEQARQEGYSDDEIRQYIGQNLPDNVNDANSYLQSNPKQSNWDSFVQTAQQVAKEQNFPVSVLLGQAALESDRGQSGLTQFANNYFGIKGAGDSGGVIMPTQEYGPQGYYNTQSQFARYTTPKASIEHYINLIKNQYGIQTTSDSDPMQVLQAIQQHGYATDVNYINKVINTPEFRQFYGLNNGPN